MKDQVKRGPARNADQAEKAMILTTSQAVLDLLKPVPFPTKYLMRGLINAAFVMAMNSTKDEASCVAVIDLLFDEVRLNFGGAYERFQKIREARKG